MFKDVALSKYDNQVTVLEVPWSWRGGGAEDTTRRPLTEAPTSVAQERMARAGTRVA